MRPGVAADEIEEPAGSGEPGGGLGCRLASPPERQLLEGQAERPEPAHGVRNGPIRILPRRGRRDDERGPVAVEPVRRFDEQLVDRFVAGLEFRATDERERAGSRHDGNRANFSAGETVAVPVAVRS